MRAIRLPKLPTSFTARDLITHLATIHNIAPSDQLINIPTVGPSSHSKTEDHGVQADLRQLLQLVLEMKTNSGQTHKLEQVRNHDCHALELTPTIPVSFQY